jgi:hypothetical protein
MLAMFDFSAFLRYNNIRHSLILMKKIGGNTYMSNNANGKALSRRNKFKAWITLKKQNIIFLFVTFPKLLILNWYKNLKDTIRYWLGIELDRIEIECDFYTKISLTAAGLTTYLTDLQSIAEKQKITTKEAAELVAKAEKNIFLNLSNKTSEQKQINNAVRTVKDTKKLISIINHRYIILHGEVFRSSPIELQNAIIEVTDRNISYFDVDELTYYKRIFLDYSFAFQEKTKLKKTAENK